MTSINLWGFGNRFDFCDFWSCIAEYGVGYEWEDKEEAEEET